MQPPTKDADKITFSFSPAFLSIHALKLNCNGNVEKGIRNCFVSENTSVNAVIGDKMNSLGENFKLANALKDGCADLKDVEQWQGDFYTELNRSYTYYFADYKEIDEIRTRNKNINIDERPSNIDVIREQLNSKTIPKEGQNFILAMVSQRMGRLGYDIGLLQESFDGCILDKALSENSDELGLNSGHMKAIYGRKAGFESCLKKMQIVDYNTETGDVIIEWESKQTNGDVYLSAGCVLNLKNHTYGWKNVEFTYDKKNLDPTALKEITGKYGEPDSNGVVKFQAPEDIKAEKFISDVETLAKKSGSTVDKQNLNIIAQTLKSLMRDMPTCLSKPEFRLSLIHI